MLTHLLRALLLATAMLLAVSPAAAEDDKQDQPAVQRIELDPRGEHLTLRADDRRLATVLDDISGATGIEFIHSGLKDDRVTVDFANVPLLEALKELLSHRSYLIQLDPDTRRPARIWVMARKSRGEAPAERQVRRIEPEEEPERTETADLLDRLEKGDFTEEDTERIIRSVIEGEDPGILEELVTGPDRDGGPPR